MEALLLAAGLGTRLRPLTNDRPKALVEVNGKTMLEINIENLVRHGVEHIVVNVHHFASQIVDFLASRRWPVHISISDETQLLLDTGGAIAKAATLFRTPGPYLIHNVDVLSRIPLSCLPDYQSEIQSEALLAVSRRATSRQLLFNAQGGLVGWHNRSTGEFLWGAEPCQQYNEQAFSGIALLGQSMLRFLSSRQGSFPVIPAYLEASKRYKISAFSHDSEDWMDVGKPEALVPASDFLRQTHLP